MRGVAAVGDLSAAERSNLGRQLTAPVPLRPRVRIVAAVVTVLVMALMLFGGRLAGALLQGKEIKKLEVLLYVVFGAVVIAAGAWIIQWLWNRSGSLVLFERGFTCARAGKRRIFLYEEVVSLSIREKDLADNGEIWGVRRRVKVVAKGARLAFVDSAAGVPPAPLRGSDPLGLCLDAVLSALAATVERRIGGGGALQGRGWKLTWEGLAARRGPPVSLSALSGAGFYGKRLLVWRGQEERPFLAVPAGSVNAVLLQRMLERRLGEEDRGVTRGKLGRMLVERSNGKVQTAVTGGAGLLLATLGPWLYSWRSEEVMDVVLLGLGIVLLAGTWIGGVHRVRFYDRGVTRRTVLGSRSIAWEEVVGVTFNVAEVEAFQSHVFLELRGRHAKPLKFLYRLEDAAPLKIAFEKVSALIAERMLQEVAHHAATDWIPGVRLTRTGLELSGKHAKHRDAVPFDDLLRSGGKEGKLLLWLADETQPITLAKNEENFYPGLDVFKQLLKAPEDSGVIDARDRSRKLSSVD